MSGRIVYELDGGEPRSVETRGTSALIGRAPDCAIAIDDDAAVSRHHAKLEHGTDGWWIHDTSSRHGTLLNDLPVPPARRLGPGDRVTIAGDRRHVIVIGELPASPRSGSIDGPTEARADLRSLAIDLARQRVFVVTAKGEELDEHIPPAEAALLAALVRARNADQDLSAAAELALLGPGRLANPKNSADKVRQRLRAWWRRLSEGHAALREIPGLAGSEIIAIDGDRRRLGLSVATASVM